MLIEGLGIRKRRSIHPLMGGLFRISRDSMSLGGEPT